MSDVSDTASDQGMFEKREEGDWDEGECIWIRRYALLVHTGIVMAEDYFFGLGLYSYGSRACITS